MVEATRDADPYAATRALGAPEPLRSFNEIELLSAADVHVALMLGELAGVTDGSVLLAVALAARAPRLGHVFVDLARVRDTAAVESDEVIDVSILSWPAVESWIPALAASSRLVAVGEHDAQPVPPLRLIGSRLYFDRYWREERQVAANLLAGGAAPGVDVGVLASGVSRVFVGRDDRMQRLAAACAVLRRLSVIAGGPGTGKTTTVARVAALLFEQAETAGGAPPLIALTAPTGKAADRLQESVHEEALGLAVAEDIRALLLELRASTIHRLLGRRWGSDTRFRHDRLNPLPHDVVIVDETSMVSLSLMARLLEAVRPDARIVLVGDPGQLTAIEAGAVLRDIVGPAANGLILSPSAQSALSSVIGEEVLATPPPSGVLFGDGIVVLERVHRFGEGIAAVAEAIRRGDPNRTIEALAGADEAEVRWVPLDVAATADLSPIHTVVAAGRTVVEAARAGDATAALAALSSVRVLCAHRRGPHGVATWTTEIERWLGAEIDGFDTAERNYIGRPLLITQNDYELGLYNGDTGVIVRSQDAEDRVRAAFVIGGELVTFTPTRLGALETLYAMTIHKSQGSQFSTAVVLLPPPESRILTRELLYTAVTRAQERLVLVGTEDMVRAAVARPVARASGLGRRLWLA